MKQYAIIAILIIFMGLTASVTGETQGQVVVKEAIGGAPPLPVDMQSYNFTKLEISPAYGNLRLKPGENKELTFTVRNKETKTMTILPKVVAALYPGGNMIDPSWISITPASADIAAGGNQKYTIAIKLPVDASLGYYNTPMAITNEEYPSPYPSPFPNYIHTFSLSVEVWEPPTIQIQNQYINDQVEAGKDYTYKIKIKNTGKEPVPIDPKTSEDDMYMSYGPYGSMQAFTNDAITLSSPKEIPAGGSAELIVNVKIPVGSKGNYRGAIDLGIQNAMIQDPYMYRVQLDLLVWTQPTEPYVKTFTVKEATPVVIDVSSNIGMYGYPVSSGQQKKSDPSFVVSLLGYDNKEIQLKKTKTVIKGGASLGGTTYPPWELDSEGIYQEMAVQYSETYTANVQAGDLRLRIMPENSQQFEYTINIGG
jgi:hypothetical protein